MGCPQKVRLLMGAIYYLRDFETGAILHSPISHFYITAGSANYAT